MNAKELENEVKMDAEAVETVEEAAEAVEEETVTEETTETTETTETAEETEETEEQPGEEASEKKGFFKKKDKKDKKDEKIEELNDRLMRQMAEFDNFRKRSEREKSQMFEIGAKDIVERILPVIDNMEPVTGDGADGKGAFGSRGEVGFVIDGDMGDLFFFKQGQQGLIVGVHTHRCVDDQNGHIGLIEHLLGAADTQLAQLALVIIARGINDQNRADGQQLHRLLYGIGGSAAGLGNDGDRLAGDGIDHAGFAGIAAAEEGDMGTVGRRGGIEAHL